MVCMLLKLALINCEYTNKTATLAVSGLLKLLTETVSTIPDQRTSCCNIGSLQLCTGQGWYLSQFDRSQDSSECWRMSLGHRHARVPGYTAHVTGFA